MKAVCTVYLGFQVSLGHNRCGKRKTGVLMKRHQTQKLQNDFFALLFATFLFFSMPLPLKSENRFDFKNLYYQESDSRMRIVSPTFMVEYDLSPTTTIKIDGIYNAISGATPSGAPPMKNVTTYSTVTTPTAGITPSSSPQPTVTYYDDDHDDEDEEDDDDDDRSRRTVFNHSNGYYARAGATPVAAPAPAPAPTATTPTSSSAGSTTTTIPSTSTEYDKNGRVPRSDVDDERYGINLELTKKFNRHTLTIQGAYSEESDYISRGISLRDSIDFNQKNTTITLGGSYANDKIDAITMESAETKESIDFIVGLFQVLNKKTTITINATIGQTDGYLTDPYKVVLLNNQIVQEKRPTTKDKQIIYIALNRFLDKYNTGLELSYRYYNDSFGIRAHTIGTSLYKKIGNSLILRPAIRYYTQTEADFYNVWFDGNPQFYSSDYRVSELTALGYGVKLIWYPVQHIAFDIAIDRYVQEGLDGLTADDVYPEALSVMAGARIWL
jgi:hypothetical protein